MAGSDKNNDAIDGKRSKHNPFIDKFNINPRTRDGKNAKYYIAQYCGSTSIHGVQYLGEKGRYFIERVIWFIIIATVATLSTILISKTYHKWVTTPVIVTFATTERAISTIPFPAITICPEVKTDSQAFNFTHALLNKVKQIPLTEFEEKVFESLSLVCNMDIHNLYNSELENETKIVDDLAIFILKEVFPPLNPFSPINMSSVSWIGNQKFDLDDVFWYSFTSEGICYSYNILNSNDVNKNPENYLDQGTEKFRQKHWSLDHGYETSEIDDSYPRRTFVAGPPGGFKFDAMTTLRSNLDYLCKESLQGFKVVLHNPAELPNMERHFRVPLNTAVYVGVKPRVTTVSDALKGYDPQNRKCYFSDEKPLAYFRNYTQNNCLQECLSNYTLKMCNCIGFYMPKYDDDPICGLGSMKCLQHSKVEYLKSDGDKCSCLPSCTSIEYDLEISSTAWDWHRALSSLRAVGLAQLVNEIENIHLSSMVVYFKDIQFLNTERNELYGVVDFLSNIGGLLGLFIGISVTSFIEILYFCTLRLYCNFKKFGRRYWSGEQDSIEEDERNDIQAL